MVGAGEVAGDGYGRVEDRLVFYGVVGGRVRV